MRLSQSELKHLRSLSNKKTRVRERKFLLEGWRGLKEALQAPSQIELVAVLPNVLANSDYAKMLGDVERRRIPVKEISERELQKVAEMVHAQGVVAVVHQRKSPNLETLLGDASLIVAADGVSDPGNLGSVLRTSDWFGADALLLGKHSVELHNEKVIRSTVGSIFHVPVLEGVDLPSTLLNLKSQGYFVVALSADGKNSLLDTHFRQKNVVVLGSEAHGVSPEVRKVTDVVVRIPKFGRAESLNLGVACGVVLAHLKMADQQGGSQT